MTTFPLALDGIRVRPLPRHRGPLVRGLLATSRADVIKVETRTRATSRAPGRPEDVEHRRDLLFNRKSAA